MTTQMEAIYIYGPTGRIAKKVNDITEFYHTDHLGSTRLTTSETGAPVTEVQYKPFGEQINTTEERYTYNGKELDDSGLYYYGARYYDPTIGRFISRDPLQGDRVTPQTLNRYAYCLNNPLKYIDPAGTEGESAQQKVEDAFARMQNVDSEELVEVQELIDAGDYVGALARILKLLGFDVTREGENLKIAMGDTEWIFRVDNNLIDPDSGMSARGLTVPIFSGNVLEGGTILINFALGGTAADMALTVLHEVSHVVLGCKDEGKEHEYIYGVEYSYMVCLRALDFEISGDFWNHIITQSKDFDPKRIHRVPIVEICKKWVRGWGRC